MSIFSGKELAERTNGSWRPSAPVEITAVCHDSRSLVPGSLYVALHGARYDGHDFLAAAAANGAVAAMVEKKRGATSDNMSLLEVDQPLEALGCIASSYLAEVGADVIAITGSAGKTTVKEMLADMLASDMNVVRTRGNWNNNIGVPLSLLQMERSCEVAVMEIGMNHPGEISPLCGILKPKYGIVTNIAAVHTEHFESVEAIAREKGELVKSLPADGLAVLDVDSEFFTLLHSLAGCKVLTVSMTGEADYSCSGAGEDGGHMIVEKVTGETCSIHPSVPGKHNVLNALFGIAIARQLGVDWEQIRNALADYKPLPMRWERHTFNGAMIIDDSYNASPVSMHAALEAFEGQVVDGDKWLVLGDMRELGDREVEEHLLLGRSLAAGQWGGLVTVGELGGLIAEGAQQTNGKMKVVRCDSADDAAAALKKTAQPGDAILLKASRAMKFEEIVMLLQRQEAFEDD